MTECFRANILLNIKDVNKEFLIISNFLLRFQISNNNYAKYSTGAQSVTLDITTDAMTNGGVHDANINRLKTKENAFRGSAHEIKSGRRRDYGR